MYALIIHCVALVDAARSCWIAGSATLTTEPSTKATLDPRMVATSSARARAGSRDAEQAVAAATPASQGPATGVLIAS